MPLKEPYETLPRTVVRKELPIATVTREVGDRRVFKRNLDLPLGDAIVFKTDERGRFVCTVNGCKIPTVWSSRKSWKDPDIWQDWETLEVRVDNETSEVLEVCVDHAVLKSWSSATSEVDDVPPPVRFRHLTWFWRRRRSKVRSTVARGRIAPHSKCSMLHLRLRQIVRRVSYELVRTCIAWNPKDQRIRGPRYEWLVTEAS